MSTLLPPPDPLLLDFNLDFYLEVQNLKYLVQTMGESPFTKRYRSVMLAGIQYHETLSQETLAA